MAKLPVEFRYFLLLVIIFCQNICQVNTLRCAHACAFGPVPFGSTDPIKTPCHTIDIDTTTTVCSVILTINFEGSYIRGTLNDHSRLVNKSSSLGISFNIYPARTVAFINYQCATTDDCDQEFVRETVSSTNWSQFNEIKSRTDISSLLFQTNSPVENLTCANNIICPWDQSCYGQFIYNSSACPTVVNNDFPCGSTLSSVVIFDQHFNTASDDQLVTMQINCNKVECNQQKTMEQAYNIIQNEFRLPLNDSAYTNDPACFPKPNGSHRIEISVFLFFIFTFLKSILF